MANYGEIEDLDSDAIRDLGDDEVAELLRDLLMTMAPRPGGGGLIEDGFLDGAMEMAEEESVESLKEALWDVVRSRAEPSQDISDDLINRVSDHEIQEMTGVILDRAAEIGADAYTRIADLGEEFCEMVVMIVEDWQTRYQAEEGVDEPGQD